MAGQPPQQQRFGAQALESFAQALLVKSGMPADKAAAVAAVLVEGDLLGHETHGLQLLSGYLEDIASGAMNTEGVPEVVADHGAVLTWDARRLPGPWIMLEALDAACERAQRFGIGAVAVRRSHHIAALAPYARRVAERGMDAGHKGYGLALMVEAFTAGLAGHGRSDPGRRFGATLFVQVLDPRAFSGAQAFTGQMDWIAARCHENPLLDPARPLRLPGERGLALRREQLAGGVRLNARIVQALTKWAAQLDVPLPPVR